MHFAICVWGIVRSLRFTIDSIHNYCLDPIVNAGHTYEIYMHTYKFSGVYENERSNERGLRLNFSEWQVLNPDHIYLEDQDVFDRSIDFDAYQSQGDPWHNNFRSFQNHLRAMNSLNYLALQVEKDSKTKHFDGIVYLRPDVTYLNELPFHLIEHLPNTLFVPDFHRSCRGGEYNDRMAMGDLQTGLVYGKKFQAALQYSQRKQLHSEKFVYDYLHMNNVTVKEIPFRFRRTRAKGEFHVRDGTAIVAPRNQRPVQEYTTFCVLRWIYTMLEIATNNTVYVWNHDDDENLYCKPHPYLSMEQVRNYRKLSRRKRLEGQKLHILAHQGTIGGGSVSISDTTMRSEAKQRTPSRVDPGTTTRTDTSTVTTDSTSVDDVTSVYRNHHATNIKPNTNTIANTNTEQSSLARQRRRQRKRASISAANANVGSGSGVQSVRSVGGSDGRDLSGRNRASSAPHSAVYSTLPTTSTVQTTPTTHTNPTTPSTLVHSEFNLRGMATRELEEERAARLKKARSMKV